MAEKPSVNRIEIILAFTALAAVLVSIVCFFAIMAGTASGVGQGDGFSQGIWPAVIVFPLFGLPIGFCLIVALIVVNAVRRSRAARASV